MSRIVKRIILTFLIWIVLLGGAAFGVVGFLMPYQRAENTMPANGTMMLTAQEDGTTQITFPRGINAQFHVLEVLRLTDDPALEVLYSVQIDGDTSCVLPPLPDEELTIRISSVNTYFFPFDENPRIRRGEQSMEITGCFTPPAISDLEWKTDAEAKTVDLKFNMPADSTCQMYYVDQDGTKQPMMRLKEGRMTLNFGEGQVYGIPGIGEAHSFSFDICREQDGYTYQGIESGRFSVMREDLLGTKLQLTCVEEGNNAFSFRWNETKGEWYELQQYDDTAEDWVTVYTADQNEERSYTTGHLQRYSDYRFRVVAKGGQTLPGSEFAATGNEVRVSTGASVVYSTIWPIQNLDIYSTTDRQETIGTAPAAQAYCVLDVVDGMFYVRHEDIFGWIDSNYCMINLPDMIGDICLYDIVNSYDSLYMAHEYELPTVTGQVIVGYEQVLTENQEFLVPLLYPTALKLEKAAFSAIEQGYKLKIYDSYRPKEATVALYDQAIKLSKEPIPEKTYTEVELNDLPELEPGQTLTYEMLMTDMGRYTMSYFLAAGGSRHNQGIAMDLTITGLWDGVDLPMQTSMHDLSWYSEQKQNNKNANILAEIMIEAGFAGLVSEWWHFQDDEAKETLSPPYLWKGVTPECWVADDSGWRYRGQDGIYLADCQEYIEEILYCFDADGYAQLAQ